MYVHDYLVKARHDDLMRAAAQARLAVIVSHPNEAVTADGKLLPTTRTKAFIDLVKGRPVYLGLSGKTMEFDGNAKCVAGC